MVVGGFMDSMTVNNIFATGENENEKGICSQTGKILIEVDSNYYRPAEVESLLGDPTKAKTQLGWNPSQTSIEELVKIMVKHDLEYVKLSRVC